LGIFACVRYAEAALDAVRNGTSSTSSDAGTGREK
jgi:hypothetical protein